MAKAIANGFDPELAKTIFSCIAGYASYGFCEGHAAAFATTSFKTAYLVRHYPGVLCRHTEQPAYGLSSPYHLR